MVRDGFNLYYSCLGCYDVGGPLLEIRRSRLKASPFSVLANREIIEFVFFWVYWIGIL